MAGPDDRWEGRSALPEELADELSRSPIALAAFGALPASHQQRYVERVARTRDRGRRGRAAKQAVEEILESRRQP